MKIKDYTVNKDISASNHQQIAMMVYNLKLYKYILLYLQG